MVKFGREKSLCPFDSVAASRHAVNYCHFERPLQVLVDDLASVKVMAVFKQFGIHKGDDL